MNPAMAELTEIITYSSNIRIDLHEEPSWDHQCNRMVEWNGKNIMCEADHYKFKNF